MIDKKTPPKKTKVKEPTTYELLSKPFKEIKWRPQNIVFSTKNNKYWGIMIPYADTRQYIDRLNEVIGINKWDFTWETLPAPRKIYGADTHEFANLVVKGKLEMLGSVKEDVGYPNNINSDREQHLKASASDALKRCCVHFGLGRFLYDLDQQFVEYNHDGKGQNKNKGIPKPVDAKQLEKLENMFNTSK